MASSFWNTPAGRAGLAARAMDRAALHSIANEQRAAEACAAGEEGCEETRDHQHLDRCSYCERLMADVVTYADGTKVCPVCTARERQRYAAATGGDCTRCPYNLAWHNADGSCPTEWEARGRSGAQ